MALCDHHLSAFFSLDVDVVVILYTGRRPLPIKSPENPPPHEPRTRCHSISVPIYLYITEYETEGSWISNYTYSIVH